MLQIFIELIRDLTREEASWAKTPFGDTKIKNNYDAGNVTKENALSSLEALLSGVEELGPAVQMILQL